MLSAAPISSTPIAGFRSGSQNADTVNCYAAGDLSLSGAAQPTYQWPCVADASLDISGTAHATEVVGGWADGTLDLSGAAQPTYQWPCVADADIALTGSARGILAQSAAAAGQLELGGSAAYAPSWYVLRPLVANIGTPWGQQQHIVSEIVAPHTQAAAKAATIVVPWQPLDHLAASVAGPWAQIPTVTRQTTSRWAQISGRPQATTGCSYSHPASNNRDRLVIPWGDMAQRVADVAASYDPTPAVKNAAKAMPWASFAAINKTLDLAYSHPARKDVEKNIESGPYWYPRYCIRQYEPPRGDQLVFNFPADDYTPPAGNALVFNYDSSEDELICYDGTWNGPKDAYWYQPHDWVIEETVTGSYYLIMNSYSLKRLSDNTPIPLMDLSIETDIDSWCWKLTANLRRKTDLDLVRPVQGSPVEVEAAINGNTFRFVVESYGDSREHGKWGYTITGRSLTAYLAAPYSLPASLLQTAQRTAAQLADEAVYGLGVAIDWQLTDWLVPANAYSVTNKTPLQQLLTIAQAAGGTVQSDPAETTLSLMPWYKTLPWAWAAATPDATLPTYKTKSTAYQATPPYTGVYVSGQTQGVMCLVKRSGTDGAEQPQMVTDQLITATECGLQRGSRILADSGHRATVTLTMPLFDDPGLLQPGMIIDVVDSDETWRGMVTRCGLSAQRPTVTQSIDVIRYYGE